MGNVNFQRVEDLDFGVFKGKTFHASPANWADMVMYFLLVDRFSDGNEEGYAPGGAPARTPLFDPAQDDGNAVKTEAMAAQWREAGNTWVGGTLKGLQSKLGYLAGLGVTCLWISPVFRQVHDSNSYHGYAIQDFLDVEPRFGTREELRELVREAHEHGIFVVLDVILNHAGDVFEYDAKRYPECDESGNVKYMDPRWDGNPYSVKGFRDNRGGLLPFAPVDPAAFGDDWAQVAVWPANLQRPETFTRKGRISNWDHAPELYEGDFYTLKDITLGHGAINDYVPSAALKTLCAVYHYWIAYADVDGYRLDTVKHMDPGAVRFFARSIHEFAQTLGKENFYLIGEIAGGRSNAFETLEATGLDAALGIDDIPNSLESMMKGTSNPEAYFGLFRNSTLTDKDLHTWSLDKIVTLLDDHDQLVNGNHKARFCADTANAPALMLAALALNATTLGIPCIYYGSEQCFDGAGDSDRYIREAMFGRTFGAFRSTGRHYFNETHSVYRGLAEILRLRKDCLPLRRGRQYLREISGNGSNFGYPRIVSERLKSIVAWSRVLDREEILLAVNTDTENTTTAWVNVDASLNPADSTLRYLYPASNSARVPVQWDSSGRARVQLSLPPAGFVMLRQSSV